MPSPKLTLVQTLVPLSTARKLAALARATGTSRCRYIASLLRFHVRQVTPSLQRTLCRTVPDEVTEKS